MRRFTPTGVGTITARGQNTGCQAVHPHGRGDNYCNYTIPQTPHGSPPRAWGQCRDIYHCPPDARFTPTGVGTIIARGLQHRQSAVHPHGRGDNRYQVGRGESRAGSPPRAWGQSTSALRDRRNPRFTPTGVGTMPFSFRFTTFVAVHPHGRGDNAPSPRRNVSSNGSPPRAWGQCDVDNLDPPARRFTPTGVGTIALAMRSARRRSVHPHGRGDNSSTLMPSISCIGSPPRAWGQCALALRAGRAARFTPTGVGTILS